jgi:hypothetical protein
MKEYLMGTKYIDFEHPSIQHIDKAIIMIACWRAINIPARLHLGKVKNHIGVEDIFLKKSTSNFV